ncbi:putative Rho GTPase activation protein [Tanacetum coccineum]
MMPNSKTDASDPKNSADSKNNTSVSKNNAADTKNNNVDQKNNSADLTKSNSNSKKDNVESKTNADASPPQGDGSGGFPLSGATQSLERQTSCTVYKSGPLFLSLKGIGWTSWKKRWFILIETSLVFFRSDPNASTEKGGEANLTLGGIDLNSSGSVVVKADEKLLTVLFPDGRDGRSFTLKTALEEALENAPSAGTGMGQTGISKNEKGENADGSHEQSKDRALSKSMVLGRPVLLALEDIDGTPSFLEKALRYVEDYGIKVEGILRQAADVELVERRIRDYEQGKKEFTEDEDGHVIGDCIKFVLRELPSSPVPASCCKALLQAYRTSVIVNELDPICDTFPEPNRRLLQRILMTMEAVAENKDVNRMSVPAVAACMSPLLLRPLLAGEVDLDSEFNMGGDGSAQLMQAAAAANHAQAIIITLLEEYDNIFGEGDMLSDLYSDSYESGSESEELSDDYDDEDDEDDDGDYSSDGSHDSEHASKKKVPIDNIDAISEERDEIFRLETLKADLTKKIESVTRHNSILKEELLSKKDALGERHLTLEQEVATLKEQLQRERKLRKVLEAGLMMSKKILPLPESIDDKTKSDLEDIAQAEAEVISLQQKVDDLEVQLNHGKVKDKEKDRETSGARKSKDKFYSRSMQQSNSIRKGESSMNKSASATEKRSNSRGEVSQTPVDTESKMGDDGDHVCDSTLYRSLAGSLQYLTFTRPDKSYAVQQVCLYMHDPREPHFSALKRILQYTLDHGLQLFLSFITSLVAYSDPISRSAEAEYRGVSNVVAETCWLRNLLRELHTPLSSDALVYYDIFSIVYLSSNPVQHQRTKHIEIDIHFVRNLVVVGQVRVLHVHSSYQYARDCH